jgi:hypothetical protein
MAEWGTITEIPRDNKGHWLRDLGTTIGTIREESVDDSTGVDVELGSDCKQVLIFCDQGASAWTFTGTDSNDNDECPVPSVGISLPVVSKAATSIGTIKAVSGTVDISIFYVR